MQNHPIFDISRNFEGWFCSENQPIFSYKDVKRSVMNGSKTVLNLNNGFLRNIGPVKIRLLQCYVELWIHNIDAICTWDGLLWTVLYTQFCNSPILKKGRGQKVDFDGQKKWPVIACCNATRCRFRIEVFFRRLTCWHKRFFVNVMSSWIRMLTMNDAIISWIMNLSSSKNFLEKVHNE